MAEIVQLIIDFFEWYFSTELPEDTLLALQYISNAAGYALFWLAERYIEVMGAIG